MNIRAKFTLRRREETDDGFTLEFVPVTAGSKENDQFFKYTPWGELKIGTINPEAAKAFEVGKEYYLDFTAAK